MTTKWEPQQSDIDWQRNMLDICKDGAIWGSNAGIYTIDKKRKVLVRTMPGNDEGTNERIKIVLKKLGWEMEDKCKS
ncbi:MAG TPA: hypothetical protein PLW50_00980 [Smithellaceae bacterium]|nr:hypothetical protein [Smithellaceae bacterium]